MLSFRVQLQAMLSTASMATLSRRRILRDFARGDAAPETAIKGKVLEELVKYVMRRVPGVRFQFQDVIVANGSEEIDLVFWNDKLSDGLPFLPNILLFECKNWQEPVGTPAVTSFLDKLSSRRLEYGFLIASSNVTGDAADRNAAWAKIDTHFLTNGLKLIVLERSQIEQLSDTDHLIHLVQDRVSSLVLRRNAFI